MSDPRPDHEPDPDVGQETVDVILDHYRVSKARAIRKLSSDILGLSSQIEAKSAEIMRLLES